MKKAVVVGAGILGLSTALHLWRKGYHVVIVDRYRRPVGASIRNFGMVWPIGQARGAMYDRALRTKELWTELSEHAGFWMRETGSLHVATTLAEAELLGQMAAMFKDDRGYQLVSKREASSLSPMVQTKNYVSAMYSPNEALIDSPLALEALANFLAAQPEISFVPNAVVHEVRHPDVITSKGTFSADLIWLSTGMDHDAVRLLAPADRPFVRVKLQMLRFQPADPSFDMRLPLCGGTSLVHYASFQEFREASEAVRRELNEMDPNILTWGIHAMVSQNGRSHLVVGDTHEYDDTPDPFNYDDQNQRVLSYLQRFVRFPRMQLHATWNGWYTKRTDGGTEWFEVVEPGVFYVNGIGGMGMTLGMGWTEELVTAHA
jgi:FAD dependent oxidoreductase TIGR03364